MISVSDDRALNKYFIKFEEFFQSVINKLLNSILNKVVFFQNVYTYYANLKKQEFSL